MAFKIITFATLVAYAQAGAIGYSAPIYEKPALAYAGHVAAPVAVAPVAVAAKVSNEPFDPHPQYSYSYDVHDTITGDVKTQQEERDGDVVRGSYSLIEPDGSKRIVEYAADPNSGFNAVVHKEPATHTLVQKAPINIAAHAAPIAVAHQAPALAVAAPLAIAARGHHEYY